MHCYQSGAESAEEPALGDLKRIADCIMAAVPGPVTINITGGEPLLYRRRAASARALASDSAGSTPGEVFELMAYLSKFESLGELNIITSASGMGEQEIRALAALPKLSYVKVSLESHDPALNDHLRWPGHHEMALEGIRKLASAGLRAVIMATLSKRNYRSAPGLCDLAESLGARGVIFERFVPLGRGAAQMGSEALAPTEWREVLGAIARIAGAAPSALQQYKAFWVDGASVSGAPCCLGPASMALMPDGTVYPCRRVPAPVGKLPGDGMERILAALGGFSATPQKCFDFGF